MRRSPPETHCLRRPPLLQLRLLCRQRIDPLDQRQDQRVLGRAVEKLEVGGLDHPFLESERIRFGNPPQLSQFAAGGEQLPALCRRPIKPQKEAIVEDGRMINAVGVADQRVGKSRQVDEPIPFGVIAGEP